MKISIRDIDHVVLRTSALDAMQQFYCTVLGCTLEKVQPDLGLVQLRAGRALMICSEATVQQAAGLKQGTTWITCACASNPSMALR